jgi:hypothetical protein
MSATEIIDQMMTLVGGDDESACRALAARFHFALKDANPDLSDAQMSEYDANFRNELADLKKSVRAARVAAAYEALTEEDVALIGAFINVPETSRFFDLLRRLGPDLAKATQETFRVEGVAIHARSAEAAFAYLENAS